MNLDEAIGTTVTLTGTADDDAAGAILELESGRVVFLSGKSSWGPDRGKRVEVTGKLDRRSIGSEPKPQIGNGLVAHGMVGKRFILDEFTWKPA